MKSLLSVGLLAAVASAASFRYSRPVEAPPGWCSLALPDDVLDACRPGLPDLRVTDAAGREVPYAFASDAGGRTRRFELANVESTPKRETTALLDRGEKPPLAQAAELEIADSEFLKPVVLEASEDGAFYREIARGSLFSASGVRSTKLRFSPNDRRFWRFRFDDRNGDPIHPAAVRVTAAGEPPDTREVALSLLPSGDGSPTLEARLPAANLGVTALRFSIQDPAYVRRVRVFERIFFRDEVSRRLVGAGTIRRSPDSAPQAEILICDPAFRNLEIEIENGDSPPLHVLGLAALARPPRLLFFSPGESLSLLYGSPSAASPRYDVPAALRGGPPKALAQAALGPVRKIGVSPSIAAPPRGSPLAAADWKKRQPIELPPEASVAYLDLSEPQVRELPSLRVVDTENRPVPHIVEQGARRVTRPVHPKVRQKGTRTIVEIGNLDPSQPPDGVTLFASAPEYFSRDLTVLEEERDARGATGDRVIGSGRWERRPGEPLQPVTISIAAMPAASLRVEIENGDNAALSIDRCELQIPFVRVDIIFAPGERLWLLSENPQASAPRYDFAMIADRVLASPARAARLGPVEKTRDRAGLPSWFWAAVVAAALLVVAVLVRTLRSVEANVTRS